MVSYLKSMYGAAANQGQRLRLRLAPQDPRRPLAPADVRGHERRAREGHALHRPEPATSLNALLERRGMAKLEWLVVKDNWVTESATFWQSAPEVKSGKVKPADIKTEVFFFPSAQVAEYDGSFTNTQRMLQWHYKAAEPPGDCRSDLWFTHQLAKRLKKLYADSTAPRDAGFKALTWDFDPDPSEPHDPGEVPRRPRSRWPQDPEEINGYYTDEAGEAPRGLRRPQGRRLHDRRLVDLLRRVPGTGPDRAASRKADPPGTPGAHLGWAWAWARQPPHHVQPRLGRPQRPAVERAQEVVWWDEAQKKWVGLDVPDFAATKPPTAKARPDAIGLDGARGHRSVHHEDRRARVALRAHRLVDGPLPAHYEPAESPVKNLLYSNSRAPSTSTGSATTTRWPRPATAASRSSSRRTGSPSTTSRAR